MKQTLIELRKISTFCMRFMKLLIRQSQYYSFNFIYFQIIMNPNPSRRKSRKQIANKLYLRETNGNSYEIAYHPTTTPQKILSKIYGSSMALDKIKILCKGRLIINKASLLANKIERNQILHILNTLDISESRTSEGHVYLSYDSKIYRINFRGSEYVSEFKEIVEEQTGVEKDKQIIIFQSLKLEANRKLIEYQIKNGDFLCMAELQEVKPVFLDVPHVIYPKKNSNRRNSEKGIQVPLLEEAQKLSTRQINTKPINQSSQNISGENISGENISGESLNIPSPNSQCEGYSFKLIGLQNWINQLGTIASQCGDEIQNEHEQSFPHPEIVLCESLRVQEDDSFPVKREFKNFLLPGCSENDKKLILTNRGNRKKFPLKYQDGKITTMKDLDRIINDLMIGSTGEIIADNLCLDAKQKQTGSTIRYFASLNSAQEMGQEEILRRIREQKETKLFFSFFMSR